MKEALILIDIQNVYFTPGPLLLYKPAEAARNAAKILRKFRDEGKPVIHIRHNFKMLSGIHNTVKPLEGEKIILKEQPSSFLGTDLREYLEELGITSLVVCGMMSHMCVDTTVRACQDSGYEVTLIYNGRKIDAKTVHEVFMASLDGMFAKVLKTGDYL